MQPELNEESDIIGYIGASTDISERKKTEIALIESQSFLNKAQEISQIGHWKFDAATKEMKGSKQLAKILGVKQSLFNFELFLDSVHAQDRDKVIISLTTTDENKDINYRLVINKKIKWVHALVWRAKDNNNNVELLGTLQDITQAVFLQKQLTQSDLKFKTLFYSSPDPAWIIENNIVIDCNQAAITMLGYQDKNNFINLHPSKLSPEFQPDGVLSFDKAEIMIQRTKEDGIHRFEWVHCKSDGSEFSAEVTLSLISLDQGDLIFCSWRDISERKQSELELQSYKKHLEDLVQERTSEMQSARDESEKANKAKSEFLSRMSHELRTPLNAILGFSQMLELDRENLNETQKENVSDILNAGEHLLKLINDVLDLATIESGKVELSFEKVNIDEVIKQSLMLITPLAIDRGITIINNSEHRKYWVQADFIRLKQVIVNLLANAVKYNSENGTIIIESEIPKNKTIRISITDTGKGLTKDEVSKLFKPFKRLNVINNVEGTGIGLIITKHLIELLNGNIGVDSLDDEGCTFWIELPCIN